MGCSDQRSMRMLGCVRAWRAICAPPRRRMAHATAGCSQRELEPMHMQLEHMTCTCTCPLWGWLVGGGRRAPHGTRPASPHVCHASSSPCVPMQKTSQVLAPLVWALQFDGSARHASMRRWCVCVVRACMHVHARGRQAHNRNRAHLDDDPDACSFTGRTRGATAATAEPRAAWRNGDWPPVDAEAERAHACAHACGQ
jgi:hypothetical protein